MKAWSRLLEVHLTSQVVNGGKVRRLSFGMEEKNNLDISISGFKYMSSLKDTFTIKISNLTYSEVIQIIMGKFYDVEIKSGYKSTGAQTIFKGGVLYISNEKNDLKTNTVIILCGSQLISRFLQSRITLSLNSGINLYSAINFVCKVGGIPNSNVSTQLKKEFLQEVENINQKPANWLESIASQNNSFILNSDAINGNPFTLFNSAKSNARVITLRSDNILLVNGYPRLTQEGLSITLLPTFGFMPGDVIILDNSIINIAVQNRDEIARQYGNYLDKDGAYMIFEMQYQLQNRQPNFTLQLTCKTRSLVSNYIAKMSGGG